MAIHEIQGPGTISPLAGQTVTTMGIVTGRKSNGFFIQSPDQAADADPNTSEGLFVFTGATPPPAAAIGNEVRVTGVVSEFVPPTDSASPPQTELSGPTSVILLSFGNPLPNPVQLTTIDTPRTGPLEQLERFEGMRVTVSSLTVISPTQGSVNEPNATSTSNGVFHGVLTGLTRPFREPGIELPDPLPPGAPPYVPRFDANPERLRVDSDGQPGATALEVTTGALVTGLTGPLEYASRTYTILPDPSPAPAVSGVGSAVPVGSLAADEFTVASLNLARFFDATDDPTVADVALTPPAFENRLRKASLAVRGVLGAPDILAVQEVENFATLQTLASRINGDALTAGDPDPGYQAYVLEGNDPVGIDVGLLVRSPRVAVLDVAQGGKNDTYVNPITLQPEILFDHPPLVLLAELQPPNGAAFPITVVGVHQRSLTGIDSPTEGANVRAKRQAQAEFVANMVQTGQVADPMERIAVVGDFNAFEFNDGYVDVMGTIKGLPTPPDQVVLASDDLVDPDLIELIESLSADQRYSAVDTRGNAQVFDHIVITGNLLGRLRGLRYARCNADFPKSYRNDPARPERISDHDAPVAYFSFPSPVAAPLPAPPAAALQIVGRNPIADALEVSITLPSNQAAELLVVDVTGRVVASRAVGALGPGRHRVRLGETTGLAPGVYILRLTQGHRDSIRRAVLLR